VVERSLFQLHVITDGLREADELKGIVAKAVRGGADVIQLRYKSASALDVYNLARAIRPVIEEAGAALLINDRLDAAMALPAAGVHLAGKSLPLPVVSQMLNRDNYLIGCSVHSVEEARQAERDGACYITYGHIFATNSKPGLAPRGLDALREVVEAVNIPVLAIGGINASNLDEVLATGVAGIAVIGAVMADTDPEEAARQLREKMDASSHQPRYALPRVKQEKGGVSR
jgi:thiamine-phosphate diphosphorylase